jgi:hypothetical protein
MDESHDLEELPFVAQKICLKNFIRRSPMGTKRVLPPYRYQIYDENKYYTLVDNLTSDDIKYFLSRLHPLHARVAIYILNGHTIKSITRIFQAKVGIRPMRYIIEALRFAFKYFLETKEEHNNYFKDLANQDFNEFIAEITQNTSNYLKLYRPGEQ